MSVLLGHGLSEQHDVVHVDSSPQPSAVWTTHQQTRDPGPAKVRAGSERLVLPQPCPTPARAHVLLVNDLKRVPTQAELELENTKLRFPHHYSFNSSHSALSLLLNTIWKTGTKTSFWCQTASPSFTVRFVH